MIGDLLAGASTLLQAQAESMMADTCVIRRRGPDVLDPVTDLHVPAWSTVYAGCCRVRFQSAETQSRQVEGELLVGQQSTLSLPYAASAAVRVDDVAEISSQGITVRVAGRFVQTYATARRFPVEALT